MNLNKLNLGCGKKKIKGYVNIDYNPKYKPEIAIDLNYDDIPLPDNSVEEIFSSHTLEHLELKTFDKIVKELYRVCCHGATIKIIVPHLSRYEAWHNVHRTPYYTESFKFYDKSFNYDKNSGLVKRDWFEVKTTLTFFKGLNIFNYILSPLVNINKRTQQIYENTMLSRLFPCADVIFNIRVIKNG